MTREKVLVINACKESLRKLRKEYPGLKFISVSEDWGGIILKNGGYDLALAYGRETWKKMAAIGDENDTYVFGQGKPPKNSS